MPSATDSRRRYSKPTSSKKPSLTSATTNLFVGKSRSNSTPNPEPVSRWATRHSRPSASKEGHTVEQSNKSTRLRGSSEISNLPDVFTFLEKDEQSHSDAEDESTETATQGGPVVASIDPELSMPDTPHYSDLEVHANEAHEQDIWQHSAQHGAGFHSDSGVSMGSNSPDIKSHTSKRRQSSIHTGWPDDAALDPFREEPYGFQDSPDPPSLPNFASPPQRWTSMTANIHDVPEAYYTPIPPIVPEISQFPRISVPPGPSPAASQPVQEPLYQENNLPSKPDGSGYDLLASSIDSQSEDLIRPIYRKFEKLNNRMLLYLQDEISEIEDRLRELDKQECQYYGDRPASRRAEARYPSHVQWHRMDLLNRSFAKVEQYNRALSSYSDLTKNLEPASTTDIAAYREWIAKRAPIAKEEATFLEHEADLVVAAPSKNPSPPALPIQEDRELETHVIIVAFTLVSTVIVFRVVPQLLARLVISAMVGVASLCTLQPAVLSNISSIRDWRKGITMYVLF